MQETSLIKVEASDYGIEETRAREIEAFFKPMLEKMVELEEEYNTIAKLPVSPSVCKLAKELRLKYVKVRTGTAKIHKDCKAYFLAAGRFVDGWKNAQLAATTGIEDKLKDIEEYYERIEAAKIEKLRIEREEKIQPYVEIVPPGLGEMTDEVWSNFYTGTLSNYEARVAAEKKAEEDRIAKEKAEREERERIRKENERLEREAQEREAAEAKRREEERKERERIEKEREKERKAAQAKLDAERKKREAAEAKIKAEEEAKRKEEEKKKRAEAKARKAPDKAKLIKLAESIKSIEYPEVSSEEAEELLEDIKNQLQAISDGILRQAESF